ncbi:hypothetical protein [Candidatus Xenohaliotis californiensis]|uniref:hypothetical protein n=1 Tax=Candidatus Xenohaliotis californiensis TaxID=84677 RepID=UPI0030C86715
MILIQKNYVLIAFPSSRYDEACSNTVSPTEQHEVVMLVDSDSDSEKLCPYRFPSTKRLDIIAMLLCNNLKLLQ